MAEDDRASREARFRTEVLSERHDDGFRLLSDRCQEAFAGTAAVRSIAHFGNGLVDFVVRPVDAAAPAHPDPAEEDLLEAEGLPGRKLVRSFQDFDGELSRFQLGELMRLVVATRSGGMYCARVRARQHVVGTTLDGDVPALDEAMNRLVTRIRTEVYRLPDEQLGGQLGIPLTELDGVHKLTFDNGLRPDPARVAQLRGVWHRFVNPVDLQYAAYYQNWTLTCAGDTFEDPRLSPLFLGITAGSRRALYRDLAVRLRRDIARLHDLLRPLTPDPVDRLVLDVQEGAVYFHWLPTGPGDFLMGVTMDQLLVDNAERRLRGLVSEVLAPAGS